MNPKPKVIADGPLAKAIEVLLNGRVELLPWDAFESGTDTTIDAVYTYGHPILNGPMLDRVPNIRVISNYGVGVDHICLADASKRGIPVGNTPGILDAATADMGFCLLLATARRLAEGDRYARSPAFTQLDPGYMLGREIHGATLGIVGMGRIGTQVARRARGFDMRVLYHNRNRRADVEDELDVRYTPLHDLLSTSDYVMLCLPLNADTAGMFGAQEISLMRATAILINIARGAIIDTDALTAALQERQIYGAGLDVTEPEPLPRNHPLLQMDNVVLTPHLGSATEQTRQRMAELSCENLLAGLAGKPLIHQVGT